MKTRRSIEHGLRMAVASPKLLCLLWLAALLVAAPMALTLGGSIRSAVGASRVHEDLREGMDLGWLSEYRFEAEGDLPATLRPVVLGRTALLHNLERWLSGDLFTAGPGLVAMGAGYALLWAFLLGGVIDRFARGRGRFVMAPFFEACGRYFFRFLRLAVLSGIFYFGIYRLGRWLFPWIQEHTMDVTVEKTVLGYNLLGALAILPLLALVNMIFAYAKIAAVVEEQPSAVRAALRGARFFIAHPLATAGVYAGLTLVAAAVHAAFFLLSPGVGQTSVPGVLAVLLLGQLFLVARLAVRLAFVAGQMRLFDDLRLG